MPDQLSCPVCAETAASTVLESADHLHGKAGRFKVVRCTGCGLMRTDPRPPPDQIHQFYPEEDYGPYQIQQTDRNRSMLSRAFWRIMDPKPLPLQPPGRILEMGASHGTFLAEKRDQGWLVSGYDFSERQCQIAAQHFDVQVQAVNLEHYDYPERDVDLVAAWMVLEHLYDPAAFLRKLHGVTRAGGWLALSVPDAGSLVYRVFGEYCYGWQLPTHLYHFERSTLSRLLEQNGWKVSRVSRQRSASMWTSSLALRDRCQGNRATAILQKISAAMPKPIWALAGLMLGLGRQSGKLIVHAQRIDHFDGNDR